MRSAALFLVMLALCGCHTEAPQPTTVSASEEAASPSDEAPETASEEAEPTPGPEPVRLGYADFSPDSSASEWNYEHRDASGCQVMFTRWWGMPPHPGEPIERRSVRSVRLGGHAGYAPVYRTGDTEERMWRMQRAYTVLVVFEDCSEPEVDAVLGAAEVRSYPPVGTTMPDAQQVCVGPMGSVALHTATPSRAGVFDPDAPIFGEHLNWMVPGVGCVTYPALSGRMACGGGSHPWVATTLCQQ